MSETFQNPIGVAKVINKTVAGYERMPTSSMASKIRPASGSVNRPSISSNVNDGQKRSIRPPEKIPNSLKITSNENQIGALEKKTSRASLGSRTTNKNRPTTSSSLRVANSSEMDGKQKQGMHPIRKSSNQRSASLSNKSGETEKNANFKHITAANSYKNQFEPRFESLKHDIVNLRVPISCPPHEGDSALLEKQSELKEMYATIVQLEEKYNQQHEHIEQVEKVSASNHSKLKEEIYEMKKCIEDLQTTISCEGVKDLEKIIPVLTTKLIEMGSRLTEKIEHVCEQNFIIDQLKRQLEEPRNFSETGGQDSLQATGSYVQKSFVDRSFREGMALMVENFQNEIDIMRQDMAEKYSKLGIKFSNKCIIQKKQKQN